MRTSKDDTDDLVRRPAVAGQFYPGSGKRLEAVVRGYLEEAAAGSGRTVEAQATAGSVAESGAGAGSAQAPAGGSERGVGAGSTAAAPTASPPKALIVPHAGYAYSGPVAASGYACIQQLNGQIERVVLMGPAHRVAVTGLATSSAAAFETPLGPVPIDRKAVQRALGLRQVSELDAAHSQEHSLEVHLPFLQITLGAFMLVPFAVGDASPKDVTEVLEKLWGGPETLIVISSDLSHFYDYETARRMDAETTRAIENLDPDGLGPESACGRIGVRGLLLSARKHKLSARTVDVRNSGDTSGPRDRVVGYGSYVFT